MNLMELYNKKLIEYKETGVREQPDKLLAMLLLPEKDNYEGLKTSEGKFYNYYKKQIDEKILKVTTDFQITDDDIVNYIEGKGLLCNDLENDKIWFVFAPGFGAMHWALMYHPDMSPEEIYNAVYDNELEETKNNVKILSLNK